jgi:hypothetical protein
MLNFFQESVVLLDHCPLKATFTPPQGITRVVAYRGMEMLVPVLPDDFDYILDGHRNLLLL